MNRVNEKFSLDKDSQLQININSLSSLNFIVNADDLGISKERDEAIFDLFLKGYISSSSILVNGFNFEESIVKAKNLNMSLGIHLNLTEGFPINKIKNNSLVKKIDDKTKLNYKSSSYNHKTIDQDEEFFGKFEFREKFYNGEINLTDIKNEIICQIERFIQFYKSPPDHIDGHQHIHIIPNIAEVISEISSNYFGIYHVRIPAENEKLFDLLEYEVSYTEERKIHYKKIIDDSLISKNIYKSWNMISTEQFLGMSMMGKNFTINNFLKAKEFYSEECGIYKFFMLKILKE